MARYHYERLTNEAADFLKPGRRRRSAHSAATLVFEAGPLARSEGGVDVEAIRDAIAARLHRMPRLRQRVRWIPLEQHPVWVDEHNFNIDYHVRHTSLPRPGGVQQLHKMAARIMSQRLDLRRPLWECWVLEGMERGRFVLLFKLHHALARSLERDPLWVLAEQDGSVDPPPHQPQPMPSGAELVRDELLRRASLPRRGLERLRVLRVLREDPEAAGQAVLSGADSVARWLGYSIRRIPDTPLNGRVGPHRRFDTVSLPLADAQGICTRLGGTLDDVVFTTVGGAVADFLKSRFMNPATIDFRVAAPSALRTDAGEAFVDRVLDLPIWEADPAKRHAALRQRARTLRQCGGPDATETGIHMLAARAAESRVPANMNVLRIPDLPGPVEVAGARLLEIYGHAPLRQQHGAIGIASCAYEEKLCLGFNADYDLVPDLDRFTAAVDRSFRELVRAARGRGASLHLVEAS